MLNIYKRTCTLPTWLVLFLCVFINFKTWKITANKYSNTYWNLHHGSSVLHWWPNERTLTHHHSTWAPWILFKNTTHVSLMYVEQKWRVTALSTFVPCFTLFYADQGCIFFFFCNCLGCIQKCNDLSLFLLPHVNFYEIKHIHFHNFSSSIGTGTLQTYYMTSSWHTCTWLDRTVAKTLHQFHRCHGLKTHWSRTFLGFIYENTFFYKVVFITAMVIIFLH